MTQIFMYYMPGIITVFKGHLKDNIDNSKYNQRLPNLREWVPINFTPSKQSDFSTQQYAFFSNDTNYHRTN